jgi:hypothetical protein
MNRHLLIAFSIIAILACGRVPAAKAGGHGNARGGFTSRSGNFNRGFSGGFGGGLGWGGGYGCCDSAELYRELYNNLPYFALHPPVCYSEPVPRTYGYSPFAYPPGVMTPEVCAPQPVTINNPYVPSTSPTGTQKSVNSDRSAATSSPVEPLEVNNPYVTQNGAVASTEQ